jgi:hypothetical protein
VLNVFNIENVMNVYVTTGQPDDSGYKGTSSGLAYFSKLTEEQKQLVSLREMDFTNYGIPRQIRLGIKVDL